MMSACSLAATSLSQCSCIETNTLPPMCPHFFVPGCMDAQPDSATKQEVQASNTGVQKIFPCKKKHPHTHTHTQNRTGAKKKTPINQRVKNNHIQPLNPHQPTFKPGNKRTRRSTLTENFADRPPPPRAPSRLPSTVQTPWTFPSGQSMGIRASSICTTLGYHTVVAEPDVKQKPTHT